MNNYEYKNLRPFCRFVLENFPFIEYDFDSLTPWKMWCALGNEINKIINSQNQVGEEVERLSNAYNALQSYVENYFENLDVQDEIDNKLDEMAENGELAEIVSELLMKGKIIFGKNFDNYTKSEDFCFIKTPSKVIMIDTGRATNWAKIYECMQNYDITHIDILIITHFHLDHSGNITNLCSGGFVDSSTKIYAQAYDSGWMHDSNDMEQQYNTFASCVSTYHLDYNIPDTENQSITVDSLCSIRFNNVDPSYWLTHGNGIGNIDYNDTSFILSITYGSIKFLTGGDAGKMPYLKMVEEGNLNESYNLFKIEHHGIADPRNALTYEIMNIINPEYTVQTASLYELSDTIDNTSSVKYQEILGFKNIVIGYNENYVNFTVTQDSLILSNGNGMNCAYGNMISRNIYVNINTTEDIQDGSENYPFKELSQALANLNPNFNEIINIYLADGIYSTKKNYSGDINPFLNKICGYKGKINIIGNTEDNTAVILKNGFHIRNSNVNISNLTISNYNTNRAIDCYNANIIVRDCDIGSYEETTSSNGIYLTDTKAEIVGCNIKYYTTAVINYNSYCDLNYDTIQNCTYGIFGSHGLWRIIGLTTNTVTNYLNSDQTNINTYLDGVTLYNNNSGSTSVNIDSSIDISKFKYLEFTITDGNITNVYKMPTNKNITAHTFGHLSSGGGGLYTKGFYLEKSSNTFSLNRCYQSTVTISSGNITYDTTYNGFKILTIKAF